MLCKYLKKKNTYFDDINIKALKINYFEHFGNFPFAEMLVRLYKKR